VAQNVRTHAFDAGELRNRVDFCFSQLFGQHLLLQSNP
jgi:hypothetical protein